MEILLHLQIVPGTLVLYMHSSHHHHRTRCNISHALSQVLLTIFIMWGLCLILTLTGVFEEGHPARTDARIRVLTDSAWFYVPYPGQFGLPTVTIAG